MAETAAHVPGAEDARRQHEQQCADGSVDEEDPGPAEVRGQHATQQHADRPAAPGGRAPDAEREVAVTPLGEGRHQQRQARGRQQRAAEPLDPAERDERARRPRERAEHRSDGEQADAGHERPPPADEVGEPPPEKQETAEHDRIGGHHPLEAGLREAEVDLDRRQRDVHDCDVEDHHELCGHDQREGGPRAGRACGVIAESLIDQTLRSLDNSTIAHLHSGMSYTFRHDHDRPSHPRETGRTAAA